MCFLTTGPLVKSPWSSQRVPRERTAGVSSRSITVTYKSTVASSFVSTWPLAVTSVVGLVEILTVSYSAELRSRLLTICILAPKSTTNPLSSGSFVDAAGSTHSSAGDFYVALSFFFELVNVF